jgi:hypothetical protein
VAVMGIATVFYSVVAVYTLVIQAQKLFAA